ncbi:MAG: MFS transporter [Gammaproteobacteria bacterium]|jgi:UMF1 family MFS transporter|nr:MFS transporter [Gammaproteobacteria bacterium]MBQ09418.1 MFS transporter [Gammaproteobacteria bacterium]MDP6146404.1 MFS transporter [Gammaproteobacteria bacterium]HJL80274.1 MFS transporter [Gammaproteobacteria bacterium]HJM09301.1 MFS transporter [Gammaproteobacteria bacterium]|tara:strand:- start:22728 stop:23987 length:1260 start_codon:yes stop_codon:yes gene_type:complete
MILKKFKKDAVSWAFYDWGNSAFATTVMAGFFPIFYKSYWASDLSNLESTAMVGYANSVSGLMVVLIAPILGAYADIGTKRKKLLISFASLGIFCTASFYLIPQGEWLIAALLYAFAAVGFSGGNVFYDSLMTSVSNNEDRNIVSALGYSLGYLGGGLLFLINVIMFLNPELFGIDSQSDAILISFLMVAIWWAIFSIPLMKNVKESSHEKNETRLLEALKQSFKEVYQTLIEVRKYRNVAIFLLAYWFYMDGIDTIVRMATAYGSDIGLEASSMIIALILTQFVGFPSTLIFGHYADKVGFKKILSIGILIYILISVFASRITTATEFYIMAIVVGLVMGGIQSVSRAYFSSIIPKNKEAQFFGFYNLVGKSAVVAGPALLAWISMIFNTPRAGILGLLILFIPGLVLLWMVPKHQNS